MNAQAENSRRYGLVIGLMTGAFIGAGLTMWLAPKSAGQVRDRVTASARRISDDVKHRSDNVRDHVAAAVARGAHDVKQFAVAVKTDRRRRL